jgi:hypothetical protein
MEKLSSQKIDPKMHFVTKSVTTKEFSKSFSEIQNWTFINVHKNVQISKPFYLFEKNMSWTTLTIIFEVFFITSYHIWFPFISLKNGI